MTAPQGVERLDPRLVATAPLYRVRLTAETLPVARRSLDDPEPWPGIRPG